MFVRTEAEGPPQLTVDEARERIRIIAERYGLRESDLIETVRAGRAWRRADPADFYYVRNAVWALEVQGWPGTR